RSSPLRLAHALGSTRGRDRDSKDEGRVEVLVIEVFKRRAGYDLGGPVRVEVPQGGLFLRMLTQARLASADADERLPVELDGLTRRRPHLDEHDPAIRVIDLVHFKVNARHQAARGPEQEILPF